jgi:glutamine amidotransferase
MIAIVSYGSGNIAAIANIHRQLRIRHSIAVDAAGIETADRYVLPGVGHFGQTMAAIRSSGVYEALMENVIGKGKSLLGICVGMQILADHGDEGACAGLGWIPGRVGKLQQPSPEARMPHMGWNSIAIREDPTRLFRGVDPAIGFYFLHSYCFTPASATSILATADYGLTFACAVSNGKNVFGVQFHPEKSHRNGVAIFQNFAAI